MRRTAKERAYLISAPWVLLAAIPFAAVLFMAANHRFNVPIVDQWLFVPVLEKSYEGTLAFQDVFAPHNEHRILFPRIAMLALAHLTGWKSKEVGSGAGLGFWGVFFGFLYDGRQYCDELVAFVQEISKLRFRNDIGRDEKTQPVMRFAGLFSRYTVLRKKICPALTALSFFDVRTD